MSEACASQPASEWIFIRRYAALILGFAILAIPTLVSLGQQSWTTELGAHGPIVLASGAWLLAQTLTKSSFWSGSLAWRGFALIIPALPLYVFGRAYDFISLEVAALYIVMIGIAWRILKPSAFRMAGFPLLYLGFLVPPPGWVLDWITAPLQQFISFTVTTGLRGLAYPIVNSGVTIIIGPYQLLVEQACSGMNSIVGLVAIMTFYIYVLHKANWRYALVLIACILPIAVLANLLRVAALVLITYYSGEAAAQGFLHVTTGMVLFTVALLLTFAVDAGLRAVINRRKRPS